MAAMQKTETVAQYRSRLKQAVKHLLAAEALMAVVEGGIPYTRGESEVIGTASELAERAADFLRSR